jgi:hypothetical protein
MLGGVRGTASGAGGNIKVIMVEEAKREPTVQEIVVALRETTFRGKGRGISVAGRRAADDFKRSAIPYPAHPVRQDEDEQPGAAEYKEAAFTDVADLRDVEMQRLLGENARLNERIIDLLKILEREQIARNEQRNAERESARQSEERDSVVREVKSALEAELRPVLLTVLHLLEQPPLYGGMQRVQARDSGFRPPPSAAPRESPAAAARSAHHDEGRDGRRIDQAPVSHGAERGGYYSGWVPDLIRAADGEQTAPRPADAGHDGTHEPARQRQRGFVLRVLERITLRQGPVGPPDGRRG